MKGIKSGLKQLDMLNESGEETGLEKVDRLEHLQLASLASEEIKAIEEANRYNADYIYFRKFEDCPSIPQVYIFDYTHKVQDQYELIDLHKRLFNFGKVPLFFVFTKTELLIFNCYESPAEKNELVFNPFETIKFASEVKGEWEEQKKLDQFSGRYFDNGTFWDSSSKSKKIKIKNSAYEKLLSELKRALDDIIEQDILPASIARRVMVISILVKYLEERSDENGQTVFPKAGERRKKLLMVK